MSHETVNFPYLVNGVALSLAVPMVDGRVCLKPVVEALGLRWDRTRESIIKLFPIETVKLNGRAAHAASIEDMEKWLATVTAKKPEDQSTVRHFQDHLGATLRHGSVGLVAEMAKRKAADDAVNAEKAAKLVEVCVPMESPDFMRKDLSLGFKRMAADVIDHTVTVSGVLDLFVRDRAFWDEGPGLVRHVQVSPEAYREKLLGDMRRAHVELLTGPEAVANHLKLPALERKVIPATKVVDARKGAPLVVTIPAHPSIFPWERAILQGTKNAKDIELPGSPYHKQRPSWIDL
jgi:hypothetical protein